MSKEVVILSAKRTAIGSFQGSLSNTPAIKLGSSAIKAAVAESGITSDNYDECIMGQVLTAGTGQAPARQAALGAGLPQSAPCITINKVCGSGLKSIMLGFDAIKLGNSTNVVAGGQENMSLAPYVLNKARTGYKMGHQEVIDTMLKDGLWDPYNNFHMGNAAEMCVKEYNFTREEQDEFAIESYKLAQEAQKNNYFKNEIVPVEVKQRRNTVLIDTDDEPQSVKFEKIPQLRPAFDKEGSITAANASSINDGAAAVTLTSLENANKLGLKPMAKIVTHATYAQAPEWFTTAPVGAMKKALKQANLSANDIDLWEINEAFSNVTMAAMKDLEIPREKVNVHGGAVSLGHPIGGSGTRIFTTLLHALKTHNKKYGMASLCIGGGEAVAVIVENI